MGDLWASEKDIGKPKSEALSTTSLPFNEDHWETHDSTTEEGARLKGHTRASLLWLSDSTMLELVWFDNAIECLAFSIPSHAWLAATGVWWTPVLSTILSSSNPSLLAAQCFSKTPLNPLLFLVRPLKCQRHSVSPRPKTPQIKQKKGSYSIWNQELNINWKTFISISTNLRSEPTFQAVLWVDLKARAHIPKRSNLVVEMEISFSSFVVSWKCWNPPVIIRSMLLSGFYQTL